MASPIVLEEFSIVGRNEKFNQQDDLTSNLVPQSYQAKKIERGK